MRQNTSNSKPLATVFTAPPPRALANERRAAGGAYRRAAAGTCLDLRVRNAAVLCFHLRDAAVL